MALFDRLRKSLSLPAGTTTATEQQIAAQAPQSGMQAQPLPRNEAQAVVPFPPALPLIPALINRPREDGRADPRRYEFPVAWNLQIVEQRAIPFTVLRQVADGADIIRKCIEVVKSAVAGLDWDISIGQEAVSRVMVEQNVGSTLAAKIVRDKYQKDITLVKDFWKMPDRINGLTFQEWIMVALEEVLVIDALSIYPNKTMDDKSMHSLEILDGATIKPLLSERGSRPEPPHPAFQQILWGFPRGEFTATEGVSGEYTADDLIYTPRIRRTNTPYGFSPVERSLVLADLYMKRLHWFRTEFTDGVIPDLMVKTDMEFGNNPQLLKGYEQVFNDALAGNLEQRRRMRLLPNGFDPVVTGVSDAKYGSDFDEMLVKMICGHFGVLPSQIGFTPKSGLGGAGHQDGEADSAETLGLRPLIQWLQSLLNQLSQKFLNMPSDLQFTFTDGTEDDEMMQAQRRQLETFSGQKTWNEVRTEMGLPLFAFPEADAPLIVQGSTVMPLAATFESVGVDAENQDDEVRVSSSNETDDLKLAELAKFVKWAKTEKARPFEFTHITEQDSLTLNELVKVDAQAARDYASSLRKAGGVRPKVLGREPFPKDHPSREKSDKLFSLYLKRLPSLGVVDTEALVRAWLDAPEPDAKSWLSERSLTLLTDFGVDLLKDLYTESFWMGYASGDALVKDLRNKQKAPKTKIRVDWDGWTAGNPDVARRLLRRKNVVGLQQLLDQAGITIKNIDDTTLNRIANVLGSGAKDGASYASMVRGVNAVLKDVSRATTIVATEMNRAHTSAQIAAYKDNEVEQVDWQVADDNACEDCIAMDEGSPYDINDLADEPPLHPNCGCQYVPALIDLDNLDIPDKALQPELVKVRRNSINRAIQRLADLPDDGKGRIAVPWDVTERPSINVDDWKEAPLKSFPIEKLFATQTYVKRENVQWHLEHLGDNQADNKSMPNILVVNNKPLIYDGHHRLVAFWLLGADYANCWKVEK